MEKEPDSTSEESEEEEFDEPKEFKVNANITLELEEGKTSIYVNDHKVILCKFLLLNKPSELVNDTESIESIAISLNDTLQEKPISDYEITPEEEF